MTGHVAAYVVAFSAMLFAGISALTLVYAVNHLDPSDVRSAPDDVVEKVAV